MEAKIQAIDKILDFLELSVNGLNMAVAKTAGIEWHLKNEFATYFNGREFIKDKCEKTFTDFSDTIKVDMDIWREYYDLSSKEIVCNTDDNIECADGIDHQREHYGDDESPYIQLRRHDSFVKLFEDTSVYEELKREALEEVENLNESTFDIIDSRIRDIENKMPMPQCFKDRNYRTWYLETDSQLREIKTAINNEFFSKYRDSKSFVYLMYLVFSCAGFEKISKGREFSKYLALHLRESPTTIDEYLKHTHKEGFPSWGKDAVSVIKKSIRTLMRIKSFEPNTDIFGKISKKMYDTQKDLIEKSVMSEKNIMTTLADELTDEENLLYKELKSCHSTNT